MLYNKLQLYNIISYNKLMTAGVKAVWKMDGMDWIYKINFRLDFHSVTAWILRWHRCPFCESCSVKCVLTGNYIGGHQQPMRKQHTWHRKFKWEELYHFLRMRFVNETKLSGILLSKILCIVWPSVVDLSCNVQTWYQNTRNSNQTTLM